MANNGPNRDFSGFREPQADDKRLDFLTYHAFYEYLIEAGVIGPVEDQLAIDAFTNQVVVRVISRVRIAGDSGTTLPNDTDVFMYEAEQVRWDSEENSYVVLDEGLKFDGEDQTYLRLMSQPGFGDKPYNYGPALNGVIAVAIPIPENASYDNFATQEVPLIQVTTNSWQLLYLGEDPVVHPFKATIDADDPLTIIVGYMRDFIGNTGDGLDVSTASHTGADLITFMQGADAPSVLELTEADSLLLTFSAGTDVTVYYEIDTSSATPTATLKETDVWPPIDPTEWDDLTIIPVCLCRLATVDTVDIIDTVGQLLFDQITVASGKGGGGTYLGLTDTDDTYVDQAGKYLIVSNNEDAVIFKRPPTIKFHAVSELDFAAMLVGHSILKEDLTLFTAITEPPCGTDPSITVTVLGAVTETVTWAGNVWELPAASGISIELCPDTYIENLNASPFSTHTWSSNVMILRRQKRPLNTGTPLPGSTRLTQSLAVSPIIDNTQRGGRSYFVYDITTLGSTNTFYSKTSAWSAASPTPYPLFAYGVGTVNQSRKIPDEYFFEWTESGITFRIERTDPADWP